METRKCKYCGRTRSIDEFEIANIINDKEYRRWKCSKCYHETKSERRRKIKQWLDDLKSKLKCTRCGIQDYRVIDFHHNDDGKEIAIADAMKRGWAKERIAKEIKKCDPVCANCHRIVHWEIKNGV